MIEMLVEIIEQGDKTKTRFRFSRKEYEAWKKGNKELDLAEPVKQNSRYVYFDVDGDMLNR